MVFISIATALLCYVPQAAILPERVWAVSVTARGVELPKPATEVFFLPEARAAYFQSNLVTEFVDESTGFRLWVHDSAAPLRAMRSSTEFVKALMASEAGYVDPNSPAGRTMILLSAASTGLTIPTPAKAQNLTASVRLRLESPTWRGNGMVLSTQPRTESPPEAQPLRGAKPPLPPIFQGSAMMDGLDFRLQSTRQLAAGPNFYRTLTTLLPKVEAEVVKAADEYREAYDALFAKLMANDPMGKLSLPTGPTRWNDLPESVRAMVTRRMTASATGIDGREANAFALWAAGNPEVEIDATIAVSIGYMKNGLSMGIGFELFRPWRPKK